MGWRLASAWCGLWACSLLACGGASRKEPSEGSGAGGGAAAGGASTGGANAGATGGSAGATPAGCDVQGVHYDHGTTFQAPGDCNTCSCSDGEVACTLLPCPSAGCVHEGIHYDVGQSVPSGDECNRCGCSEGGAVYCTEIDCIPTPTETGGAGGEGGASGGVPGSQGGASGEPGLVECPAERPPVGTPCGGTLRCSYDDTCRCGTCCTSSYDCADGAIRFLGASDACYQIQC